MDGFALRSEDTPGRLPIVARIAAGVPAPRALEAGEAMAIATGASSRPEPTPSSPSSTLSRMTTAWRFPAASSTVTTSVLAVATLPPATSSCRAVLAWGLRRSERLPLRGWTVSWSRDALASQCLRRARSCAGRASRSGPARCTRRTVCCWRQRSPPPAPTSMRYRPSPTTSRRTALRSSEALRPTCSSPRAASPSARTISFAGS